MQGVEGIEKFLLGGYLAGNELDIVHHQHVHVPVFVAELGVGVLLDRLDQLIGKGLAGHVDDLKGGEGFLDLVADGVHQMGFAQAHAPVHEQGVVGPGWAVRHGPGRGIGEIVGGADDEIIEGIAGVHHHFRAVVRQLFVLLPLVAQDKKGIDRIPLVDLGEDLFNGDRV